MTVELAIVLAVTLGALILFITEVIRVDLVSMLALAILLLSGIITPAEGISGFGNEATVTIAAMFVLSEGLHQTGALEHMTRWLGNLFRFHFRLALLVMMIGIAITSAFINNVAVVAIMLPVVLGLCRTLQISATKILIPLSFAAMFGGTTTLIGTSANLVVNGLIIEQGLAPIAMFEMTRLGLIFSAAGIAYLLLFAPSQLPDRSDPDHFPPRREDIEYQTELRLTPDHPRLGDPISSLFDDDSIEILALLRGGHLFTGSIDALSLAPGDRLRVCASAAMIRRIEATSGLHLLALHDGESQSSRDPSEPELFEIILTPEATTPINPLTTRDFSSHHPGTVLAIRRAGHLIFDNLIDAPLRGGDILLMEATRSELRELRQLTGVIVLSEVALPRFKEHLLIPVLLLLAAVVFFAAIGLAPIVTLAVAAAVALVLLDSLDIDDAYRAIDWQVIFLLGGFIPLGIALENTGAIALLAGFLVSSLGDHGPLIMLAGFYLTTNFMSDLISNNATAVLMTPLAITTASVLGVDPRPFVIAVAFAASASFASPVGYHTNVMIYAAGNYRYTDFIKIGVPLNLLFLLIAVLVIPQIWAF